MNKNNEYRTYRVFLSSRSDEMKSERQIIKQVLANFADTKFIGMENFGADAHTPITPSVTKVLESNLLILLLGDTLGQGIVEAEYQTAMKQDIDCIAYCTAKTKTRDSKTKKFIESLKNRHTPYFFFIYQRFSN